MADVVTSWTEERVELLAKLWSEGLSASQIAASLGGGVTRNAVIGKVHRLGLAGRGKAGQPAPARAAKVRPPAPQDGAAEAPTPGEAEAEGDGGALPAAPQAEEVRLPVSERVRLVDLREGMCRWPLGDPSKADFGFCGGRSEIGVPYCAHHCRLAYQPAAERKRIRA